MLEMRLRGTGSRKCRGCWATRTSRKKHLRNFSDCATRNRASKRLENKSSRQRKSLPSNSIRLRHGRNVAHTTNYVTAGVPPAHRAKTGGSAPIQGSGELQKPWRALLARPDEDVWAYVACGDTIPGPSFTVTSWLAATLGRVCHSPFGQRIFISAVLAWPNPKCRRKSLQDRKLD